MEQEINNAALKYAANAKVEELNDLAIVKAFMAGAQWQMDILANIPWNEAMNRIADSAKNKK